MVHLYSAFNPKRFTIVHYIHPFTHRWRRKPCKAPTYSPGAIRGSESCPRTLRHQLRGSPDLNWEPFGIYTLRALTPVSLPLSYAAPHNALYLLLSCVLDHASRILYFTIRKLH